MNGLIDRTIAWADSKGILANSTVTAQFQKHVEEIGEVGRALLEGDNESLKKEIGDVIVTAIIMCELAKQEGKSQQYTALLTLDKEMASSDAYRLLMISITKVYDRIESGRAGLHRTFRICQSEYLTTLAHLIDETPESCLRYVLLEADDALVKRTGEMNNGVFIKDTNEIGKNENGQ